MSDWQWFLKYFKSGGKYSYIKIPVSIFYLGGISTSKKFKKLQKQERNEILNEFYSKKKQFLYKLILKITKKNSVLKQIKKLLTKIGILEIYENYYNN